VLTAIAELGFVRNESARQLRSGSSRTLAYVVLDASNPFFTDVATGVQGATDAAGLALFLCNSGQSGEREAAYLDLLEQQRVEGILITPVDAATPGSRRWPPGAPPWCWSTGAPAEPLLGDRGRRARR